MIKRLNYALVTTLTVDASRPKIGTVYHVTLYPLIAMSLEDFRNQIYDLYGSNDRIDSFDRQLMELLSYELDENDMRLQYLINYEKTTRPANLGSEASNYYSDITIDADPMHAWNTMMRAMGEWLDATRNVIEVPSKQVTLVPLNNLPETPVS
jgi:hypothetical protein